MNRIVVIGSGGSGKSTLARQLGEILDIEVIHLDAEFWNPGWVETSDDKWAGRVERLARRPRWIIDGNYGGTMEPRLAAADTIVFLDLSRTLCVARALKRAFVGWCLGRPRPDMADGCPERLDGAFLAFIDWIWNYPIDRRPRILRRIDAYRRGRRIHILRSPGDVQRFVDRIRRRQRAADERRSM